MINKSSEVLYIFARESWKKYTFTQIKDLLKKNSKSYIQGVIENFVNEGIIQREKIGNLPIYSLNFNLVKSRVFAGFVLENYGLGKKNIPYRDMQKFMDKIPYKGYVFIITGSYAKERQTKNSDIDVVTLIEDSCEPRRVYAELSQSAELNIPQIHLYVFKYSEFKEMLYNKEPNYGKEIVKNCLILSGGQIYINLIKEAIENGFNDRRLYW